MPLDSPTPSDKATAIIDAFGEIGRVNGTMIPRRSNAKDRIAYEYWVSSLLNRLSEARRDKARRAAVAGGVLPDHAANPMPVGTVETVYAGGLVTIAMKVVEQADRVDVAGLMADLEAAGVAAKLLKRLAKRHTRTFPGAHVFTASLVA